MKLRGRLVPVAELSPAECSAMLELMDRHYDNVAPAAFERDLAEKQWVICLAREDTGALCGFSTQMVLDARVDGRPIKALFSGDTIIDRQFWGDQTLMLLGGRLALSLIDQFPEVQLYWFLISAGYKTYRFLPVFFREFYPRYDVPTPAEMQRVIETLARAKFADRYHGGIVRADSSQYRLRDGVADLTAERLLDPHVQFFAQSNPGHAVGDELCCIARLARSNFSAAAERILA